MSKSANYKNAESLHLLEKLLEESRQAVADPNRDACGDPELNEVFTAVGGMGVGASVGFAALYFGGVTGLSAAGITSGLATAGAVVGGGMAAGIAVLAAPVAILGVGGYAMADRRNKRKLKEKKEMLLQSLLRKHNAIIKALQDKSAESDQRVEYLTRLNTLLQAAIRDLREDLSSQAA